MTPEIDVEYALKYLRDGGLGETVGFTEIAFKAGAKKVQMDTDMAMALLILAGQTIAREKAQ